MASTANVSIIKFTDGREICLSYGVPVAAFIPADYAASHTIAFTTDSRTAYAGYIKTDRKYSVTTSRHANAYAGNRATVVPDSVFCALIAPLETKR